MEDGLLLVQSVYWQVVKRFVMCDLSDLALVMNADLQDCP